MAQCYSYPLANRKPPQNIFSLAGEDGCGKIGASRGAKALFGWA